MVVIGDEACVKHVYRQKESLLLISDNPKYAPMAAPVNGQENGGYSERS